MKNKWVIATTIVTGIVALASSASAQESTKDRPQSEGSMEPFAAPTHALELSIGSGYAQGWGAVGDNQRKLADISQGGGAIQLAAGYRILPQLTLGAYGSGSVFGRAGQLNENANIYEAAAGVYADWHAFPRGSQLDPWISLGSGWIGYWTTNDTGNAGDAQASGPAGNTSTNGVEWGRLQVGVDYRIDNAVAISPVVGADLSTFFTQSSATSNGWQNINTPTLNTFFFAGVQGRFDIPTETSSSHVASR